MVLLEHDTRMGGSRHKRGELPPFDSDKLDRALHSAGVDAVLASSRHACRYLLGGYEFHMFPEGAEAIGLTRYLAFVGYRPGRLQDAFYIASATEREGLEQERPWPPDISASSWTLEDSVAALVSQLTRRSLDRSCLGVEMEHLPAAAFVALQRSLPDARIVDVAPVLEALRMVKQPYELAYLRSAAAHVESAMTAAAAAISEGQTTLAIAEMVRSEAEARGVSFDHCFVSVGPSLARTPSSARWRGPAALAIDFGGRMGGYVGDVARMFCLGKPTAAQARALMQVTAIQSAASRAIGPGAPGGAVKHAAESTIDTLGVTERASFLVHGLGLVSHEAPWLVDDAPWRYAAEHAHRPLESGAVLSIETTLSDPEAGFVKIEDMVAVTDTGTEPLSGTQDDWFAIGPSR